MESLMNELSIFFQRNSISLFGICDASFLEKEPEGTRPSDMLPSAVSVLCFGLPIPRGFFIDKKRINRNYWRIASTYYHTLDNISSQAALLIETRDETAVPVLS